MKKNNRGGIGTLAALSGGFSGLSFNSLDTINDRSRNNIISSFNS